MLPPVPGFSDPPLRSPDDKFPPVDPKALLIDVRSVAVEHFDDIWVDGYHFRGGARVDGSFVLKPAIHAQIGPAKLTFESGEVRIGKATDGISVLGDITATFDTFAPLEYQDAKVFEVITAQVKLEGAFQKLQALAPLFQAYGTRLEGGTGKATIDGRDRPRHREGRHRAPPSATRSCSWTPTSCRATPTSISSIPKWNLVSGPIDVSGTSVAISETREFRSKNPKRWSGRFDIPSGKIDVTTTATVRAKVQDARPLLAVLGAPLPGWTKPLVNLKDLAGGARATLGPSVVRIQGLDCEGREAFTSRETTCARKARPTAPSSSSRGS